MGIIIALMWTMSIVCLIAGAALRYQELGQVEPVIISPETVEQR